MTTAHPKMTISALRATEDRLIWRQLRLIKRNYVHGVIVFTLVSMFTAFILYNSTDDARVLIWLTYKCVESIICVGIFKFCDARHFGKSIRQDLTIVVVMVVIQSLTYCYLPLTYIPSGSADVVILLSLISAGLAAGSVALSSPFFIGFVASSYPGMMAVAYSLFLREESMFRWTGVAFFLMLMGLTWFALTLRQTIKRSIAISMENQSLVSNLRHALDQADDANRAKSVFLASASHDLRQPLHAVGLLNETLGHTQLDEAQREIHQHMNSALGSTREMLDALLSISKLEAGAITPQPKPFLVRSVLNKLEPELAPTADQKGLVFRTRETIAAANADPLIVELILRNLIANAIRYTDNGGLLVACRKRTTGLSIEVWDTGSGIDPNQQAEIFKAFHQLDNPERDSRKGFGLGLAIAQGLAATIDSTIEVRSSPGCGSVFRFIIPSSEEHIIEDIADGSILERFDGVTVMVIDDDPHILASMNSVLTAWGCECVLAESVDDALNNPLAVETQLLLTDYRLRQNVTGKEVVRIIRETLNQDLPAIIVTGDTAAARIRDAQSSGALLLHKPASASQLHVLMRRLLTGRV